MIKSLLLILFLIQVTHANAAEIGADWWKNCPGPGCPAKSPVESYEKLERSGSSEKTIKDYKQMENHKLLKERERHEKALEKIEKEERKREISR